MLTFFKIGSIQFSRNFECTFDKNKPFSLKKEGEARTRSRIFLEKEVERSPDMTLAEP